MTSRVSRGLVLALILTAATGITPSNAGQGRFWPGKERWRDAFRRAARDPVTWAPAAGAAVIGLGDWDAGISEWATREAPVFGSSRNALDWSDDLRTATHITMLGTLFLVEEPERSWKRGFRRLVVQHAAAVATTTLTSGIKAATDRERPDRSDRESFPSGHGSRSFSYAASGRRNLQDSHLSRGARAGLGVTITTLAGGTAWARVEAGKHYPTDVLVGAALGNFVTVLINDAFLGMEPNIQVGVHLEKDESSFVVVARW
jgi:membrane-associated phospholipid phosphatase